MVQKCVVTKLNIRHHETLYFPNLFLTKEPIFNCIKNNLKNLIDILLDFSFQLFGYLTMEQDLIVLDLEIPVKPVFMDT
ncbi:hypothetical protein BpHYR1_030007 [Brachionus plicatilis]|uniref:Uncharacterized protein n=1 Tax=Brachionus plicatilis TaxID=10195 RepID=A0A3M7QUU5_BRAPC|nr:hypothetical protein BpHYR1_030007 [Brachionus plicatilis]